MLHNNDADILNTIFKNSRMAYDCTEQVASKCKNPDLSQYLGRQLRHYAATCASARRKLEEGGRRANPVPPMQRAMAHMGISMKTAVDSSSGHIAELMYNGTNMGIVDIARSVNHSVNASDDTKKLAEDLLGEEEKYADGLRKFL